MHCCKTGFKLRLTISCKLNIIIQFARKIDQQNGKKGIAPAIECFTVLKIGAVTNTD
jgi:hypothetical protein